MIIGECEYLQRRCRYENRLIVMAGFHDSLNGLVSSSGAIPNIRSPLSGLGLTALGAGFSAPHRRNSAGLAAHTAESRKKWAGFLKVFSQFGWCTSCPHVPASIDVFRAALVSIVLTLTLGQNAALLCVVWCHPQHGVNGACEDQVPTTSPSVTANESCASVATGPTAFVREEGRKLASASDGNQGIVVAPFQCVAPPSFSAHGMEQAQSIALEARPLVLALLI